MFGMQEWIVIVAIAGVLFFGPAMIRRFGKSAGEAVREGKAAAKELQSAIKE